MCSEMLTYMFYVFGHAYIYVLCVRTCLHICFMCSDMVTCMFYVFGHAYIYVLCVWRCLHVCFMCSDMLTYMFYVFGHGYFIIEGNTKKLPFINLFSILIFTLLFLKIFDGSIIINWHLFSFINIPLFLNHVSKILMSDSSSVMILCIQMSATDN